MCIYWPNTFKIITISRATCPSSSFNLSGSFFFFFTQFTIFHIKRKMINEFAIRFLNRIANSHVNRFYHISSGCFSIAGHCQPILIHISIYIFNFIFNSLFTAFSHTGFDSIYLNVGTSAQHNCRSFAFFYRHVARVEPTVYVGVETVVFRLFVRFVSRLNFHKCSVPFVYSWFIVLPERASSLIPKLRGETPSWRKTNDCVKPKSKDTRAQKLYLNYLFSPRVPNSISAILFASVLI